MSVGSHGYAQFWEPSLKRMLLLHRWIVGAVEKTGYDFLVDHRDRDRMNCRKSNLRMVTPAQSNLNRTVAERDLPRGVYLARGRYAARVKRHRKMHNLGTFDTPDEAARAVASFTRS